MSTTLSAFLAEIDSNPEAALVFQADGETIRPEYHVTEIKHAHIRSLDCGRGESEWNETLVQLLDGPRSSDKGGSYMTAGKFAAIAKAGLGTVGNDSPGELFFEFAPGNAAARKLSVHSIDHRDDAFTVKLGAVHAVCKPAGRIAGCCPG